MKNLTHANEKIMDYEHKYKESLEKARKFRDDYIVDDPMMSDFDSIFPELAESEDDRIRKGLIKLLTVASNAYLVESTGIKKDSYLAYLEKQKEKVVEFDHLKKQKSCDGNCDKCPCYNAGLEIGKDEQKPAEWSEEDEHRRTDATYFLESAKSHYADTSEIEKTIVWLKDLPLNLKKRNDDIAKLCSNKWNEEDETRLTNILIMLKEYVIHHYSKDDVDKSVDWLTKRFKSLCPQPKEELAKMLQDEYNKGNEIGEREGYIKGYSKGYKDANESASYHLPVMPTTPSGFGCDGTHCTNPHMDCINCPIKSTGGMLNTASSSGDLTLKAEWKPSEDVKKG